MDFINCIAEKTMKRCFIMTRLWRLYLPRWPTLTACDQIHRPSPPMAAFSAAWCHFWRDLTARGVQICMRPVFIVHLCAPQRLHEKSLWRHRRNQPANDLSRIWKPHVVPADTAREFGHSHFVVKDSQDLCFNKQILKKGFTPAHPVCK